MNKYPILNVENEKIKVNVECREYTLGNTPLFSSVVAAGNELLSRPMQVNVVANGKPESVKAIESFTITDENSVTVLNAVESELFIVNTQIDIEDDGCSFIRLTVAPKGYTVAQVFGIEKRPEIPRVLSELTVEIPLKKEFSEYYQVYPWKPVKINEAAEVFESIRYSGAVPSGGLSTEFVPQLYLCNEKAGCGVFFESDEGWQPASTDKAIEVIDNGSERIIRIDLLESEPEPWRASSNNVKENINLAPITFKFGFMATPVRDLPKRIFKEHCFHIDCFKKIDGNYEDYFSNSVVEGDSEIGFDRLKRLGVDVLYIHEKWNDLQNSFVLTDKTKKRARYLVSECHKRGIKVIPYFGYEISTLSPLYGKYADRVVFRSTVNGLRDSWNRWPVQRADAICYNDDEFREAFVKGVCKIVDELDFDGIYIDSALAPRECFNSNHGCSYTDKNGVKHPTYSFTAVRKLLRPIYEFMKRRNKTVQLHGYGVMTLTGLSYADSLWEGENFQSALMRNELTRSPEDLLKCLFTSRNLGVPVMSLCYSNPPTWTYEEAVSMALLHGSMPKPVDIGKPLELTSRIWKIYDEFPIETAEFVPYYENTDVRVSSDFIRVSYYDCEDKILAVIGGVEKARKELVTVDFSKLNVKAIVNALTGESLQGDTIVREFNGMAVNLYLLQR